MTAGWFKAKGVQDGKREFATQMIGLDLALAETKGKTVLDLGCAEGLIGREFAQAGATSVHGVEMLPNYVEAARGYCAGLPMTIECAELREYLGRFDDIAVPLPRYDIVIALAIVHKLHEPEVGLRFCARSARSLVVLRLPSYTKGMKFRSKFRGDWVFADIEMTSEGFKLERAFPGPYGTEPVQYWRRIRT